MPMHYIILFFAIVTETIGTTALQASNQFSKFWPSVIVVVAYSASFYLMALALKVIPVGIAYAIWSGVGILMIAIIGFAVFGRLFVKGRTRSAYHFFNFLRYFLHDHFRDFIFCF